MNSFALQLIFINLFFSFAYAAENFCSDWETYKEEKCIKLHSNANLQSFADAEKTCTANENSKLISIHSSDEQTFLENYLFKQKTVVDNIWLSAKSDNNHVFHWNDGRPLTFSNWAPNNPKVSKSTVETCLQMSSDELVKGKWANEPCTKKNLVLCERKQKWTLEKMQEVIERQHEENEKLQKTLEQLQESNKQNKNAIEKFGKNLVPIGFIYIQLPNQKNPQEIWPLNSWTDDSALYDSNFFRVVGSKTEAFGKMQEEFSPYLDEISFSECKSVLAGQCQTPWGTKTLHNGGWSLETMSASLSRGPESNEWYRAYLKFHIAGGEIRPKNMAIKVWRRSA